MNRDLIDFSIFELQLYNEILPAPIWDVDPPMVCSLLFGTPKLNESQLRVKLRLLQRLPLTPLTGADNEWEENGINKRCPTVIRSGEYVKDYGKTKAFAVDGNGKCSLVMLPKELHKCLDITFPYYPDNTELMFFNVDSSGKLVQR